MDKTSTSGNTEAKYLFSTVFVGTHIDCDVISAL